ncbi:MAG: type II toxin-antitoxin system HicA family toxin [Rhodospirillaceae bacterium]|nr:type II toxin-antitoxin system HicA family toxin [Rhodospirillaceae bacterium]
MSRHERLLERILRDRRDTNIRFADLVGLMRYLGFEERITGSHYIFRKEGIVEKVNLQRDGSDAKPYQVRQVRQLIAKYRLGKGE